jgi:hypothetical protein
VRERENGSVINREGEPKKRTCSLTGHGLKLGCRERPWSGIDGSRCQSSSEEVRCGDVVEAMKLGTGEAAQHWRVMAVRERQWGI